VKAFITSGRPCVSESPAFSQFQKTVSKTMGYGHTLGGEEVLGGVLPVTMRGEKMLPRSFQLGLLRGDSSYYRGEKAPENMSKGLEKKVRKKKG